MEELKGDYSIADLCRREDLHPAMYCKWSKDFLEAGKIRVNRDTVREANTEEVNDFRSWNEQLKQLVAGLSFKITVLKKIEGFRVKVSKYMRYTQSEKMESIRMVEQSSLSVRKTLRELEVAPSLFYTWYKKNIDF